MRSLISYFIKYPFWSNVFIIITFLAGGYLFMTTKRSLFPERKVKDIFVEVRYLGASPEEIEESITDKVEDNLRGIDGIDEILSTSFENNAKIQIVATNRVDVDELLTDVKNAVDQISSFPTGAEKPKVYKDKPKDRCMYLVLTGDKDLIKTKEVAERVYDDFLETGFISQVSIQGVGDPEISIELSENDLERYNLSLDAIQQKMLAFNRDLTIGSIRSDQQEFFLRFKNKSIELEKLKQIPILTSDGEELKLGDISTISYQLPPDQPIAKFKGESCVNINVNKIPEEDILQITDYLRDYSKEFNNQNRNYKLDIIYDASESVRDRIKLLQDNGLMGLILVFLVLGIFMNFRLSFWVAFGIPMGFLGMFILTGWTDLTINQMSLFGLILVSGILVDDGIVISENIYTKIEQGIAPAKAAYDGVMEVLPAVFTSVLTTVLVFCGFFFVEGSIGELIPEIAIVVIGCLTFSLLEAAFMLPGHLNNKSLKKEPTKVRKWLTAKIDAFRYVYYRNFLEWALEWKWVSLTIGIVLTMIGLALFKSDKIGKSFFPVMDSDLINIEVAFYTGQSAKITEKYLEEIDEKVLKISDSLASKLGSSPIIHTRYSVGANSLGIGNHAGTLEVRLKRAEERTLVNDELSKILRNSLQLDKIAPQSTVGGRESFGKPISYRLVSKNKAELDLAKEEFKKKINTLAQVADVTDNSESNAKEIVFKLTEKAINLGFTPNDIVGQLRSRFFGSEIQKLTKSSKEVRVWVRLKEQERDRIFSLNEVKIRKDKQLIPLTELATWEYSKASNAIKHYNGMREISIEASNATPSKPIGPVIDEIKENIIPYIIQKYPDVRFEQGGQAKSQQKLAKSAIPVVISVLLLIYFIIAIQFRSWLQPLMILLLIFPTLIGAALGHYIENSFVVIMSYLGGIALLGILVNDAIVLFDRINENLRNQMKLNEALIEAGISRLRPIVMTSITTMAGLYPLIFEASNQAKFLIPMAITLTYGVLFSTLYTLMFLPSLFACFNDLRLIKHWIWTGEWKEAHEVEPAVKERVRLLDEGYKEEDL
jgi:multidrug efflux pump subunit AcrB